jgi:hypothetical protein
MRFNLHEERTTEKGKLTSSVIANGLLLKDVVKRIVSLESRDEEINSLPELIKWQIKRYDELSSKLFDLGKKIWEQIDKDTPKRLPRKKINDE